MYRLQGLSSAFFLSMVALVAILGAGPAFGQTSTEVDIQAGAGASASATCVSTNNCFSPNPITVAPGTEVVWNNGDTISHTVTSGQVTDDNSGSLFDSGLIKYGSTFQFTFSNTGTYDYFCTVHPWMTGQVIVGGSSNNISPPPNPQLVSISTDLPSYKQGDTIVISGRVDQINSNAAVTVRILNSHNNLVSLFQVTPSSDGTFTQTLLTTGPLWVDAGTFTVIGQYGPSSQPITTTFYFSGGTGQSVVTPPSTSNSPNVVIATGAGSSASAACVSTNNCFSPNPIYVSPGTEVEWKNGDTVSHTVTSGKVTDAIAGSIFDSGLIKYGNIFQFTFSNAGTYDYFCSVHPWMTGQVIVGSGNISNPPPQSATLSVMTDKPSYNQGDVVTTTATLWGISSSQNVAISVTDPSGNIIVSRVLSTSYEGSSNIQFKIPATAQIGTYQVVATSSPSGNNLKQTTQFTVNSQYAVSIVSVQPTDQQGNSIASFTRGATGYVKVVFQGQSNQNGLITINLFDSDSTSIGIGSLKGSIANGQSEIVLSFSIPKDAVSGNANIYADIFSDYPSKGGTPLTSEISSTVEIK